MVLGLILRLDLPGKLKYSRCKDKQHLLSSSLKPRDIPTCTSENGFQVYLAFYFPHWITSKFCHTQVGSINKANEMEKKIVNDSWKLMLTHLVLLFFCSSAECKLTHWYCATHDKDDECESTSTMSEKIFLLFVGTKKKKA